MQPDNNLQNNVTEGQKLENAVKGVTEMGAGPAATQPPKNDVVFNDKPKKSSGMAIGLILCILLAICGIGFGVWTMMDGNAQKEQLNKQIDSLKQQKTALETQISELEAKIEQYENGDISEILPPSWGEGEAVIVENKFTIKNANGEIYTQLDDQEVLEIVSCDSGTEEAKAPLTCVVKTADGEAKVIYNYDEHSLEFVQETE